jgi:hypothetical protein
LSGRKNRVLNVSMTDKELAARVASEYKGPLSVTFWVAFSDKTTNPTVLRTGDDHQESVEFNTSVLAKSCLVKGVHLNVGRVWLFTMARGPEGRWVSF